jgi:hypothetical protein
MAFGALRVIGLVYWDWWLDETGLKDFDHGMAMRADRQDPPDRAPRQPFQP